MSLPCLVSSLFSSLPRADRPLFSADGSSPAEAHSEGFRLGLWGAESQKLPALIALRAGVQAVESLGIFGFDLAPKRGDPKP